MLSTGADKPVDEALAIQSTNAVLDGLVDPDASLPSGVRAALLRVAGGTFLLKIEPQSDASTVQAILRRLSQELEHH